jgi:hypothetical protein
MKATVCILKKHDRVLVLYHSNELPPNKKVRFTHSKVVIHNKQSIIAIHLSTLVGEVRSRHPYKRIELTPAKRCRWASRIIIVIIISSSALVAVAALRGKYNLQNSKVNRNVQYVDERERERYLWRWCGVPAMTFMIPLSSKGFAVSALGEKGILICDVWSRKRHCYRCTIIRRVNLPMMRLVNPISGNASRLKWHTRGGAELMRR